MNPHPRSAAAQRRAPVIGITGNIGVGKSTVAGLLAARGVRVIDADRVVHDLYADPNGALAPAIAAAFGAGVVAPGGALDRAALGSIVFNDAGALAALERLVHPAVVAAVERDVRAAAPRTPVAIEAVKLIESDLAALLDAVWLVTAAPAIQAARLRAKGMADDEARRRIEAQTPPAEKIALLRRKRGASAPVMRIDNTGTLAQLRRAVDNAWQSMQAALSNTEER